MDSAALWTSGGTSPVSIRAKDEGGKKASNITNINR